jgi:hypothetical protein
MAVDERAAVQAANGGHRSDQVIRDLAEKVGSKRRHLVFVLCAGTACAAGLPDLAGLAQAVSEVLDRQTKEAFARLSQNRTLEAVLSHLRLISAVLASSDQRIDGLGSADAQALDRQICESIAKVIIRTRVDLKHHIRFGSWLARSNHDLPIELFTTNYDLLLEQGLEIAGAPYFDGFLGVFTGRFRADLIDTYGDEPPLASAQLPAAWTRLWKLHGSVSWAEEELPDAGRVITRTSVPESLEAKRVLAIYPSFEKYQQSRRLPFVALADRFRRSLATAETFVLVCGYSFGDEHINELLFETARLHPATEVMILCRKAVPAAARERALEVRNLVVLGRDEAIIGGVKLPWQPLQEQTEFQRGAEFLGGDFAVLVRLLAGRVGQTAGLDGGASAS